MIFNLSDIKIENASFNLINKKTDENKKDKKNGGKTNIKEKKSIIIKKDIDYNIDRKKKMIQILHQVAKIQRKETIVIIV